MHGRQRPAVLTQRDAMNLCIALRKSNELAPGESLQIMPGEAAGVFAVRAGSNRVEQVLGGLELSGLDGLRDQPDG